MINLPFLFIFFINLTTDFETIFGMINNFIINRLQPVYFLWSTCKHKFKNMIIEQLNKYIINTNANFKLTNQGNKFMWIILQKTIEYKSKQIKI
jgi:hypothetical protein